MMKRTRLNSPVLLSIVSLFMLGTGFLFLVTLSITDEVPPAQRGLEKTSIAPPSPSAIVATPTPAVPEATPIRTVSPTAVIGSTSESAPAVMGSAVKDQLSFAVPKLIVPVVGIKAEQLRDNFNDKRSESRPHNAIDIMAPQGSTVVAATEGRLVKLFFSDRGGITIYQTSADEKLVFYYAHLMRYAEGIKEGQSVRQGETIAFVGDTGNAGAGNYHLHFAMWTLVDPKRYWDGVPVNPYPFLRDAH